MTEMVFSRRFIVQAGLLAIPGLLLGSSSPDQREGLRKEFDHIVSAMLQDTNLHGYGYLLRRTSLRLGSTLTQEDEFQLQANGTFAFSGKVARLPDTLIPSPTYELVVENPCLVSENYRYSFTVKDGTLPAGSSQQDLASNNFHVSEVTISNSTDHKFIFRWNPESELIHSDGNAAGMAITFSQPLEDDFVTPWILTVASSTDEPFDLNDESPNVLAFQIQPSITSPGQYELINNLTPIWLQAIVNQKERSRLDAVASFVQTTVPLLQQIS